MIDGSRAACLASLQLKCSNQIRVGKLLQPYIAKEPDDNADVLLVISGRSRANERLARLQPNHCAFLKWHLGQLRAVTHFLETFSGQFTYRFRTKWGGRFTHSDSPPARVFSVHGGLVFFVVVIHPPRDCEGNGWGSQPTMNRVKALRL